MFSYVEYQKNACVYVPYSQLIFQTYNFVIRPINVNVMLLETFIYFSKTEVFCRTELLEIKKTPS